VIACHPVPELPGKPLRTPDGRYMVVRDRLWRLSNPALPEARRAELVSDLMAARGALRRAADEQLRAQVRARIDAAKRALGERGPIWWTDGAPDYNRHLVENTPYAVWYAAASSGD
jgi:hypothetical protein